MDQRVALVTGSAQGIGRAIAETLAMSGHRVVGVDIREQDAGPMDRTVLADLSDTAAIEALTPDIGAVDILVNNAAIYPARPWTEIDEDEWDRVLATNLKGYFLCARAAHSSMVERGRGRIINIASVTFLIGFADLLDYVSSKGGVVGFTRALAREVGPEGVTVNAVSPGAFPTDAEKIHPDPVGYNQWILDQQSLKRRGTPQDVGDLVAFLASDAASFITGQLIGIDGGWAMH